MGSGVEFRILGPFEVVERGCRLELGGARQQALPAVLVVHRREAVSIDVLIDALWGESPPPTAAKTIHVYISRLRKALGDGVLETRGRAYRLALAPDQVDVDRFEALVAEGHAALEADEPGRAVELIGRALALWRGPPLGEFAYESFAQSEISRLQETRLAALGDRIDAELALGPGRGVIGELEALVHEHPLNERFTAQLMLALYRHRRQADALGAFRRARRALVDELGIEPGRELRELERAILTDDPGLQPRSSRRAFAVAESPRGGRRRGLALAAAAVSLAIVGVLTILASGGSVTALDAGPNSLAEIDPGSDTVVGTVAVGDVPGTIAFGSGSLWVANLGDRTISQINPSGLQTLRTIALGRTPTSLAASASGIWVVESDADSSTVSVSRIDPQFDDIAATERLANVVPGGPGAVAARGSLVWVAPSSGVLTRLDANTGRILQQLDPNSNPTGVAIGDGAVWVTDSDANNVTRIEPGASPTAVAVGNGPSALAAGAGSVWVADSLADELTRIDQRTAAVTASIGVGRSPGSVAVGAGAVWVTDRGDGAIVRIDPRTDRVTARIKLGGSPQAIAIADGRVWVTVDARTPPREPATGGTLRIETLGPVDYMDPALAYTRVSWQVLYATCAKLLNYPDTSGAPGGQLTPEVAQALPTRSPDGKTYTFTIRSGFRFSPPSDQPVTAQTFKYTIERSLNPRMDGPLDSEFTDMVGAAAYMTGKARHIAGVVAQQDRLTIHLIAPEPDIVSRLAQTPFCAVPTDTPLDPSGVPVIPMAGPYYVTSYTPGQSLVLTRNPNYAGSRPHSLAWIELTLGVSPQRAVADIERGAADYTTISGEPVSTVSALASALAARYGPSSRAADRGRQQYFEGTQPELDYLVLNTHRALFSDVQLRRAVNYAIDRRALARPGNDRPTDSYLPRVSPEPPAHRSTRSHPTRPRREQSLAATAGLPFSTPATTRRASSKRRSSATTSPRSASDCKPRPSRPRRCSPASPDPVRGGISLSGPGHLITPIPRACSTSCSRTASATRGLMTRTTPVSSPPPPSSPDSSAISPTASSPPSSRAMPHHWSPSATRPHRSSSRRASAARPTASTTASISPRCVCEAPPRELFPFGPSARAQHPAEGRVGETHPATSTPLSRNTPGAVDGTPEHSARRTRSKSGRLIGDRLAALFVPLFPTGRDRRSLTRVAPLLPEPHQSADDGYTEMSRFLPGARRRQAPLGTLVSGT